MSLRLSPLYPSRARAKAAFGRAYGTLDASGLSMAAARDTQRANTKGVVTMYRVYYQIWLRDQVGHDKPFVDNMATFSDGDNANSFVARMVESAIATGDTVRVTVAGFGTWHEDEDAVELSVN